MSTPAHRVSFDTPLPVPYGSKKQSVVPLPEVEGLDSFLREHSLIPAVRQCSVLWHVPCKRPPCPWCADVSATARRSLWNKKIDPREPSLFVRLSVASHHNLSSAVVNDEDEQETSAWSELSATRARFQRSRWLKANSRSWMRTTEVTYSGGLWHLHDNYVVFGTPSNLETVKKGISSRWVAAATAEGVVASPEAVYADYSRSTAAVSVYIVKGIMDASDEHARGQTPGDLLRAYHQGDADAGERWHEIERLFLDHPRGIILTQRGGTLRGTAAAELEHSG